MNHNIQESMGVTAPDNIPAGGWTPEGHYVVDGVDLDYGDMTDDADQAFRMAPRYAAQELSLHSLDPRVVVASGDLAISRS